MKFKISILLVSGLLATALGAPQQRPDGQKSDLDTSNRGGSDSEVSAQTPSGRQSQSPSSGQQNTSSAAPNSGSEEFYGSTSAEENDVDDFGSLEGAPQQGQPQFLAQNPQGPQGFSPQQGFNQFSPFGGAGGGRFSGGQQVFIGPNGQLIGGGQGSPQFFNQQGLPVQSFSPQAQFQGQQGLNQFGGVGGVIQPGQFQGQFNGLNGLGQPQFQNGGAGFQFSPDSGSGSAEFGGFPGNRPQLAGGRPLQGQVGGVVGGAGRPQQPFDSIRGGQFASGPQSTGFPILTTTAIRGQPQQVQQLNEGEFNTSLEGGEFNEDAEQDGVNNVLPQSPVRAATPSRLTTNATPSTDGTPFGGPQVSRQNLGLRGNVNFPGAVQGNPLIFNGPQGPQVFNGQGQQITEAQLQQLLGGGPQGPQGPQGPGGFRPGSPQQQQQFNQQFQQFNPQQQQFNPQQQQFQQFNPQQFQQFNPQFGGFTPNGFSPIQGFQGNQINGAFPGQGQQQFTTNPQGVSGGIQQQQSPNAGFIQGGGGAFSPSGDGGVQQFNPANGASGAGGPRPGSVGFPVGFPVGVQQVGGNPQQQFIQGGGVGGVVGGPGGQQQFIGQQQGGVNGIQSAQGFGGPFDYSPFGINGGVVGPNGQVFPGQFGGQPGGVVGGAFSPFGQQGGAGGFPIQGQFLSSGGQQGGLVGGANGGAGQRNGGGGGAQGSGGAASSASQETTKSASASDESKKST